MATAELEVKKDQLEELADFYSGKMRGICPKLAAAVERFSESFTYADLLQIEGCVEDLRHAMMSRTSMRTHSASFRQRYPEKTADAALDVA